MRFALLVIVACSSASHEPVAVTSPPVAIDAAPPDAYVDDCPVWDDKNPACRGSYKACEHGWADCVCKEPDVNNPACWAVMACPNPPDRRVRACAPKFPACQEDCPVDPVFGRVLKVNEETDGTYIIIGVGQDQGLGKYWSATLLRGDSDEALPGGAIEILRVTKRETIGRVHADAATLQANQRVKFFITR
ncbi:MAG: hypothetical protein QM831_31885 [Kofleriaceae bacterium]